LKKFVAFARVSSREQEREGFSLDVQEESLKKYAKQQGGEIVKFTKVAETASDESARRHFNETVDYTLKNAGVLDGILFYKVDRAIRNTHDLCKLEDLEHRHGVLVEFTSQPFPHSPAGWMSVRNLANMATFQTQQQSVDVKEGVERRVRAGLFPQKTPYGYQNYRERGRSLVRIHPEHGRTVRRIHELYAYHGCTIDEVIERLELENIRFTKSKPRFTRSKVAWILQDQSYIGEIRYKGDWWPGTHDHIVDAATWERVQTLRVRGRYQAHELLYGGELITCGHCGHTITGEAVAKKLKGGGVRKHVYYRCAKYTTEDHPRIRLKQAALDEQVLSLFQTLRIADDDVRDWVVEVLRKRTQSEQKQASERVVEINKQLAEIRGQQDELLEMRLHKEIEGDLYTRKNRELRERESRLTLEAEAQTRGRHENADLAIKAFELSQNLVAKWDRADFDAKRRLLEIVCLNLTLVGVTLSPEWRKPFDILAEGLPLEKSRGDWIRTSDLLNPIQAR
jgi:site-specific DNA recombinase